MSIEKSTFDFLKKLEKNNNRDWFHDNKKAYQAAKENFEGFIQETLDNIAKFDAFAADLTPKECIFRINRDIRFAKDKSPYKTGFGANMSRGGRKSMYPGYYFHLEPNGKTMVAGGMYMPQPDELAKLRQEIDYNAASLKKVLNKASFKKWFPKGLEGEAVKTAPKGYSKDHPEIELLRQKSFVVWHYFDDKDVFKPDFSKQVKDGFKEILSLNQYLRTALD